MTGSGQGLFIVFEGMDGSGKTFHLDAVKEALLSRGGAIHSVVFPNNRTPLGRFLKDCLQRVNLLMHGHIMSSLLFIAGSSWIGLPRP